MDEEQVWIVGEVVVARLDEIGATARQGHEDGLDFLGDHYQITAAGGLAAAERLSADGGGGDRSRGQDRRAVGDGLAANI
ncbi:hypothetical protein [Streptomyces mirabilis]|uniref:hypothetical protein n=1 Tax=Streptomyces mirabilis TaxID=68239 RepID=UPI00381E7179